MRAGRRGPFLPFSHGTGCPAADRVQAGIGVCFEQTNLYEKMSAAANLRLFEQARPWLDEDLVDFLFSVPGTLRTDNRLTQKMLEMAHPDLAAIPFAQKDSIPQAHTYRQSISANPALGEFIRAQCNERLDPRLNWSDIAAVGTLPSGLTEPRRSFGARR